MRGKSLFCLPSRGQNHFFFCPAKPTPNSLYPGARVALLCASSTVPENRLEPSIAAVKALGLAGTQGRYCLTKGHGAGESAEEGPAEVVHGEVVQRLVVFGGRHGGVVGATAILDAGAGTLEVEP